MFPGVPRACPRGVPQGVTRAPLDPPVYPAGDLPSVNASPNLGKSKSYDHPELESIWREKGLGVPHGAGGDPGMHLGPPEVPGGITQRKKFRESSGNEQDMEGRIEVDDGSCGSRASGSPWMGPGRNTQGIGQGMPLRSITLRTYDVQERARGRPLGYWGRGWGEGLVCLARLKIAEDS